MDCERGDAVVSAIVTGRWEHATAEIREHAGSCEACRELIAIATRFHEVRDEMGREVRLPSAGQVWWRSAIRGRLEDQRAAERPLVWLYAASIAVAAGLTATLARLAAPTFEEVTGRLAASGVDLVVWRWASSLAEAAQPALPFVLGAGAALLVLLLPLLYVALSDD